MQRTAPRKEQFVKALKEPPHSGRTLTDLFVLAAKSLAISARNSPYLRLTLADRTGSIEAFVWDDAETANRNLQVGDVVEATFQVRLHNGIPQLRLDALRPLADKDLEHLSWDDFRAGLDPATRERLWADIEALVEGVTAPPIRQLLQGYTRDPGFRSAFLDAAAAKGFHHAYVGGLADHTLAVMRLAQMTAALYPERVNADLLLAGAFLHDLGKVEELSRQTGDYTTEGRLTGHIVLGVLDLRRRAAQVPGFPDTLLQHLEHLILSHHGEREWGAPVLPQTAEAVVLHYLDNLDAKLAGVHAWLEGEDVPAGAWSTYWKGLGRQFLRTPTWGAGAAQSGNGFGDIEDAFLEMERAAAADDPPEAQSGEDGSRDAEAENDREETGDRPRPSASQGRLF